MVGEQRGKPVTPRFQYGHRQPLAVGRKNERRRVAETLHLGRTETRPREGEASRVEAKALRQLLDLPDVRGLTPTGHLQLPARGARLRLRLCPKAN